MKRREAMTILGILAAGGVGAPKARADEEPAYLPLEIVDDGCIVIAVDIAGVRRTAVLDSGATLTMVGSHLTQELAMAPIGRRTISGSTNVGNADAIADFEVRVGAQVVTFRQPVSVDLSTVSSAVGRSIDLIVGHDLFSGRIVELDLPGKRWSVRPRNSGHMTGTEVALTFGARGEPTLQIAVEGRPSCAAVLDLGTSAALTMSRAYATANDLLRAKRTSNAVFATAAGTFVSTSVMADAIDLAGVRMHALPAEVVDAWISPEVPAVVGLPVLRRFRLVFDYERSRIWMSPDQAEISKPFPEDHAGLGLARDGDHLVVKHVAVGSPAAAGGWREGEVIVAVDGRSIREAYADEEVRKWRNREPGTRVILTLAGGDRRELVLADYY